MKTLLSILVFALLALGQQTRQERIVLCTDAGASDTYACTPTPAVTSYTTGLRVRLYPNTANTGAATVNISTLGAKTIVKVGGGITTALADNDIRAGQYVELLYDGTNMQILSQLGNAASGGGGGASLAADGEGIWYPFGWPQTQVSGGVHASLRTYFHSFVLPFTMSVDTIGFRVQTLGGASAGLTVGVYNAACSTLLASGNKSSGLNVAGYYTVTFADTSLTPGLYYIAWATDDTTLQLSGAGMAQVISTFGALPATAQYFYGTASTGSGATLALPASCGSRTAVGTSVALPHFALIP